MANAKEKIKKLLTPEALAILFILLLASILRFKNLEYSDYIGDEHKAFLIPGQNQTTWDFLLKQRKGPMQFVVSYIPRLIVGNFNNELAERIPFSIISVLSVPVFYLLVKKLTKNKNVSLFSTSLFMVNGFIVGFGRIAQYQNLNIIFSLLALYFYSDLIFEKKHLIRSTLIGTIFWSLSVFSHWDAVFIAPVVLWFFISFFREKDFTIGYKIRVVLYNLILGCLILLPFIIPYVKFHTINTESTDYFERRIAIGKSNRKIYKMFIDLYNPFITFWLLVVLSILGLLKIKKTKMFLFWFAVCYIVFEIFWRKPGTHIYNFLIPIFILSGFGFDLLLEKSKKFKVVPIVLGGLISAFLYYQSYLLFVDHAKEYPWEREIFFSLKSVCKKFPKMCKWDNIEDGYLKTQKYYHEYEGQKLPLFGFPHSRNWDLINSYINELNAGSKRALGYSTNEDQVISIWYMNASYKSKGEFYFVGIKRPSNFVGDLNPPHGSEREIIKEFYRDSGDSYAKIFKVRSD